MPNQDYLKNCQSALKDAGYYGGAIDGIPGPQTAAAFEKLCAAALDEFHQHQIITVPGRILTRGDAQFDVTVEGADLWVRNVKATCFGGSGDSMDDGQTASGFNTKGHGGLLAVSLPMRYTGHDGPTRIALQNSPIPDMPFGIHPNGTDNPDGAHVEVFMPNGKSVIVPVIDRGPNIHRFPRNAIDFTRALARMVDPAATANSFDTITSYRIIGGSKYV